MDLGFKPQFKDKILNGTKIHTIREDVHKRWKPGRKIAFVTGARTKERNVFFEATCTSVDDITIYPTTKEVLIYSRKLTTSEIKTFATNDGFDNVQDFWKWFEGKGGDYRLIHWTDRDTDDIYLPF